MTNSPGGPLMNSVPAGTLLHLVLATNCSREMKLEHLETLETFPREHNSRFAQKS
jgi:hypothetical protein